MSKCWDLELPSCSFRLKTPSWSDADEALPRHSKVEAHLESYFHMEDFCVLYFLFCFLLVLRLCLSSWNFLNVHLLFISSNQSSMNFNLYDPLYRSFWFFICIFIYYFVFFLADFCCYVFTSLFSGGLSTELIAAVIVAVAAGGHGYEAWKAIAIFSIIFIAHARQHDAAKLCCTMPSKWHKFEAFHVLQLPWCRTGLCLVLIVCMPLGRIKLISFIFFFRMLAAQGQTTNAQAIRISRNICWKKRLNITKSLDSAHMIRLNFSCATDLGVFSNQPGCAGVWSWESQTLQTLPKLDPEYSWNEATGLASRLERNAR